MNLSEIFLCASPLRHGSQMRPNFWELSSIELNRNTRSPYHLIGVAVNVPVSVVVIQNCHLLME